jgi:hypothetical protein
MKIQEASCNGNGANHMLEHVDWVAVDEGTYFTPSGSMWQVGCKVREPRELNQRRRSVQATSSCVFKQS